MLFQRINRSDPEKVYCIVQAAEGLLQGHPVCLTFNGTNDGVYASLADAASQATAVIGLADSAIAASEYGLVQVYGFRSDAKITNASSIPAGGQGAYFLVASQCTGHLSLTVSIGASTIQQPNFIAANSASVAVTASSDGVQSCAVFIRCM